MEFGHHHLSRGDAFGRMYIYRNAASVVFDSDAAVAVNGHLNMRPVPGHGFVDAVVHHLIDQVVESLQARAADVHGGAFAHCLQALEHADATGIIGMFCGMRFDVFFAHICLNPYQRSCGALSRSVPPGTSAHPSTCAHPPTWRTRREVSEPKS